MDEHDYSHITNSAGLDSPEGLAPRLSQQEVAGEVPKRATLTGAHRSRLARDVPMPPPSTGRRVRKDRTVMGSLCGPRA